MQKIKIDLINRTDEILETMNIYATRTELRFDRIESTMATRLDFANYVARFRAEFVPRART